MFEQTIHEGAFSRTDLMQVAASVLSRDIDPGYALKSLGFECGKLTILSGPFYTDTCRFLSGLIPVVIGGNYDRDANQILYFSRRRLPGEAIRDMLRFEFSRLSAENTQPDIDNMARAIELIEALGIAYYTSYPTITEVCRAVEMQASGTTRQLVVVEGLEYFDLDGEKLDIDFHDRLQQLEQLARNIELPVVVTCLFRTQGFAR